GRNKPLLTSSPPLVHYHAVFDFHKCVAGGFFAVVAAEEQEDRAAAVLALRVAVFPDLRFGSFDLVLAAGLAKRRLHPAGAGFARLDLRERALRNVISAALLV